MPISNFSVGPSAGTTSTQFELNATTNKPQIPHELIEDMKNFCVYQPKTALATQVTEIAKRLLKGLDTQCAIINLADCNPNVVRMMACYLGCNPYIKELTLPTNCSVTTLENCLKALPALRTLTAPQVAHGGAAFDLNTQRLEHLYVPSDLKLVNCHPYTSVHHLNSAHSSTTSVSAPPITQSSPQFSLAHIEQLQSELLNNSGLSARTREATLGNRFMHAVHKMAHLRETDTDKHNSLLRPLDALDGDVPRLGTMLSFLLHGSELTDPELVSIAQKIARQANKHDPSPKGVADSLNQIKLALVEKISQYHPQFAAQYAQIMRDHIKKPTTALGDTIPQGEKKKIYTEMNTKLRILVNQSSDATTSTVADLPKHTAIFDKPASAAPQFTLTKLKSIMSGTDQAQTTSLDVQIQGGPYEKAHEFIASPIIRDAMDKTYKEFYSKPYPLAHIYPSDAQLNIGKDKIIYRSNHGMAHVMRKAMLSPVVAEYLKKYNPMFQKMNSADVDQLVKGAQLFSIFSVAGRQNEMSHKQAEAYLKATNGEVDVEGLASYASGSAMLDYMTENNVPIDPRICRANGHDVNAPEANAFTKLYRTIHNLDEMRCFGRHEYEQKYFDSMKELFGGNMAAVRDLMDYDRALIEATGDRCMGYGARRPYSADIFLSCSTNQEFCLQRLTAVTAPIPK